jgi:hypothetical protein
MRTERSETGTLVSKYTMIVICYYYWYSALGPVWAETRAQAGNWYGSGMPHPGQILRGSLPLLSPFHLYSSKKKVEKRCTSEVILGGI